MNVNCAYDVISSLLHPNCSFCIYDVIGGDDNDSFFIGQIYNDVRLIIFLLPCDDFAHLAHAALPSTFIGSQFSLWCLR